MKIKYTFCDATRPEGTGAKIICHVCNDVGAWGAGFVMALSGRWNRPRDQYIAWHDAGSYAAPAAQGEASPAEVPFALGEIQMVGVEPGLHVCNMIAQAGTGNRAAGPPIRYEALRTCLRKLADEARHLGASVHMPKIGAGIAGGDWNVIAQIVEEELCDQGIRATVYLWKG